jgi:hypothetical protein
MIVCSCNVLSDHTVGPVSTLAPIAHTPLLKSTRVWAAVPNAGVARQRIRAIMDQALAASHACSTACATACPLSRNGKDQEQEAVA